MTEGDVDPSSGSSFDQADALQRLNRLRNRRLHGRTSMGAEVKDVPEGSVIPSAGERIYLGFTDAMTGCCLYRLLRLMPFTPMMFRQYNETGRRGHKRQ